jgi:hypothetical protein
LIPPGLTIAALVAALGVAVVATPSGAVAAAGGSSGIWDEPLVLHGAFDPPAEPSKITVRIKPHRSPLLQVDIAGAPVQCDDGTAAYLPARLRGEIKRNGEFRIAKYFGPSLGAETRIFVDLQGQFKSHRVVKGTYTFLLVSFVSFQPSCATAYPLPWRADR